MIGDTFIPCCSVENCAAIQSELESLRQQHERDQRVIEAAERLYVEALALIESVPECSALAKNMEAALTGFREAKEKS